MKKAALTMVFALMVLAVLAQSATITADYLSAYEPPLKVVFQDVCEISLKTGEVTIYDKNTTLSGAGRLAAKIFWKAFEAELIAHIKRQASR